MSDGVWRASTSAIGGRVGRAFTVSLMLRAPPCAGACSRHPLSRRASRIGTTAVGAFISGSRASNSKGRKGSSLPPPIARSLPDRGREALEHRPDRVREGGAASAGEAQAHGIVARLGHHQRPGVARADEAAFHLVL